MAWAYLRRPIHHLTALVCVMKPFSLSTSQDSSGAGGSLAGLSGSSEHDYVLHWFTWTLPCGWDLQLSHTHILVHPTGTGQPRNITQVWCQVVLHWLEQIWGFKSWWCRFGCLFQDEITSLDAERQTLYLQIYRPVYFQLVDVLLQKACFPRDEDYATWSADDKEQFRTYRLN